MLFLFSYVVGSVPRKARMLAQGGKTEALLFQPGDQRLQVGRCPGIAARPDAHVGHEDIAVAQAVQRLLQQYSIRKDAAGELVAGKAGRCPGRVAVTAVARGRYCTRRSASAGSAPEGIEVFACQFAEARVDAPDLVAVLRRVPFAALARVVAELGLDDDAAADAVLDVIHMVERVGTEGMALGHARLPVRRPGRVERVVAPPGFLVRQEEGGADGVAFQRGGDQFGLRLAARIEGQVDRAGALRRRPGRRRGTEQRQGSEDAGRAHLTSARRRWRSTRRAASGPRECT